MQTFERVLAAVDAAAVERVLLVWQAQVLGPVQEDLVIVDGKAIRHAKVEVVSAVNGKGRWLGTVSVAKGSNEIPAARAHGEGGCDRQAGAGRRLAYANGDSAANPLRGRRGLFADRQRQSKRPGGNARETVDPTVFFPPPPTPATHAFTREYNCGRAEVRVLDCREVTPAQAGFPGARLIARLRQRVRRKGKKSTQIVYLISSLSLAELQALGWLKLKRNYWVIESRLHHPLDVSLGEDQSRVRQPNAALVLGMVRRVVVSCALAWLEGVQTIKTTLQRGAFPQAICAARRRPGAALGAVFAVTPTAWC